MNIFADQPLLPTIWFIIIGVFWIGYLILEGFDFGVGMMMSKVFSKNEKEKRLLLNTIGPVWDGNEVWIVTGGAATFAAFPFWYASLFSALYIPLTLALVFLILRVVAIDYRGKHHSEKWVNFWNASISVSSFFIAFLVGALLGITSTGLPINENGDVVGAFTWVFNPFTYIGGLGIVLFSYLQGLAFIALKTDGEVRYRASKTLVRLMPLGVLPCVIWVLYLQFTGMSSGILSWAMVIFAVISCAFAYLKARAGREGWTFVGTSLFITTGALAIFLALYPNVFPSTLDPAYSLNIANASSSPYTLTIMTWLACLMLPFIILYQAWGYYMFRKRMTVEHIPDAHDATELATMSKGSH
ncbi:cytochrome d ubiquinol oxidase subunit II [Rothia sp. P13129]|uniref:cytochrome d ubiquinol oxidase subunit II n=1 Tax=unclassified Rothia (in: high G+C Gram-positive bacteria) TaxID=2689056 RepID=UPI003AC492BF